MADDREMVNNRNFVYILECADGTFYTGWTTDISRRIESHNSGKGAKYTKSRRPVVLVYSEEYDDKIEAQHREREIKKMTRNAKEELIKGGRRRKRVYLAADADIRLADHFRSIGYEVSSVKTKGIVADPVSNHPDMFMCKLGVSDKSPIVKYGDLPDTDSRSEVLSQTDNTRDHTRLSGEYPDDIAFNAACTGKFFIHNLKYTAPEIMEAIRDGDGINDHNDGMVKVDVKQGYAKCSTVIVDEDSIITYDRGLASDCIATGMEEKNVLVVRAGYVELPGYDTGFIGGAGGRVDDTVYFNGNLRAHPDFESIVGFIEARGLRVRWFDDWPLTDIGSIISTEN